MTERLHVQVDLPRCCIHHAMFLVLLVLVPVRCFHNSLRPTKMTTTELHQSALAPRWAMPDNGLEHGIRDMLDEAVMAFQQCTSKDLSTDEAESIVGELSRLLHESRMAPQPSPQGDILQAISNQLDKAVMQATHDPTALSQVEALAVQYHQVMMQDEEEQVNYTPSLINPSTTVMDQVILSESQLRLQKLRLSLSNDSSTRTRASTRTRTRTATTIGDDISLEFNAIIDQTQSSCDESTDAVRAQEVELDITNENDDRDTEHVDIAIVGAGIGGLCAGAILNTVYGKKVGIYESHYLAGGCAHAFERVAPDGTKFTFDSGPTIVLGCSAPPYNPLRQVLDAVGQSVEWISYEGWGMIENPGKENEVRWKVDLGEGVFQEGPVQQFGGKNALREFEDIRRLTKGLVSGAVGIPALAMRSGKSALIPLLRYLPALFDIIKQGEELTQGTFRPYMDGPIFEVTDPWLRSWLDALAFSLSGLPASRTSAAAMAYVLFDMHRPGAALDYPRGGLGTVIDALVKGVEQGENDSKVNLRSHVECIDTRLDGARVTGLTLRGGKRVIAKEGVIYNAPVWSLNNLIKNDRARKILGGFIPQPHQQKERKTRKTWIQEGGVNFIPTERQPIDETEDSLMKKCDTSEMTGSFLHLHIAIKADGLDLSKMEAHYTVMDRSLCGDGSSMDGPCGELNMIAVSNPCVIDRSLAPAEFMVLHAYGAGNEPYALWEGIKRGSAEYVELKEKRSAVLWRAIESIIPDVRERVVLDLVGSPITHERFLRRPMGTYGAATEDYLKDGSTPYETLVLAGDGVFPGIGVPAVALSGASAANSLVSPIRQWKALDKLKRAGAI